MSVSAYSNPNLTRSALPATTLTEATSVADLSNQYRARYFLDQMSDVAWLNEYSTPIMDLLELAGSGGIVAPNPKVEWTEASRLETASLLEVAIADTSGQYVKLVDPGIANVGMSIYTPTGEWMIVLERDLANGLSGGTNLKVQRGAYGTVATTHAANTSFIAAPQYMAEMDIPRLGTGTMPGKSQYNFATIYAKTYNVTRLNNGTVINGGWGQLEKERLMNMYALRREIGQALYFSPRYVESTTNGPKWVCGGLAHGIKSNVLSLDSDASKHTWENLDAFFYNLKKNDASSGSHVALVGRDLFFAHKKIARETSRLEMASSDAAKLGEQDYVFNSEYGPVRYVLADKDLPSNPKYNLGSWGFFVDPKNIYSGTLTDFGSMQLVPDIQEKKQGIMVREDAVVGSIWIAVKHESTHGIIKGAPKFAQVPRSEIL